MKKIFLGIILVISACSFSRAQDGNASQAYELQTCIDIALENNLTLRRTLLNQGIVEADLLATQGSRLPSITAFASSGYRWGRSINPVTNLFETRRIGNINTQVNSNMPIFNGFQITNSIAQARKNYESANSHFRQLKMTSL